MGEYFLSQESLATVIDNDEDDDDEDQEESEDKVETPNPETDAEQERQPDDNKCKQTANTTASKSNQFHENFRENDDFTKKNQDDPNAAATTANAPQHPSDGDDVDTASNNVDTIQTASKKTTTV